MCVCVCDGCEAVLLFMSTFLCEPSLRMRTFKRKLFSFFRHLSAEITTTVQFNFFAGLKSLLI